MQYVPFQNLTDSQWGDVHANAYSLRVRRDMKLPVIEDTPPLQTFYNEAMRRIEEGSLVAWGIERAGNIVGHVSLIRVGNDWDLGVVIASEDNRGKGWGVQAALMALQVAFSEMDAPHVTARMFNEENNVTSMAARVGFRRMADFWYIPREVWLAKWEGRVRNG